MRNLIKTSLLAATLTCLSACSTWFNDPYVDSGAKGAVIGGAAGAGTGAIIGATISSGDVAASALLGGAIGVPAGVLLGVALHSYTDVSEIEANNKVIEENYKYIISRQQRIDDLREEIDNDYKSIKLDKELRRDLYIGHTLGNYNR